MLPFLREEKVGLRTQVTFTGKELNIYIPSSYLEKNMAVIVGQKVDAIGLYWFSTENKYYELQIPVKMSFEFSSTDKKRMKIQPNMPSDEYMIFTLVNSDAFLYDVNYKKSIDDITFFTQKLVEGGKIPNTVAYDEILPIFMSALEVTDIKGKIGVPSAQIEFLLSELYRDKGNLSKPFRLKYAKEKNVSPYAYRMLNIVKVPQVNSTFTSLTGEDVNQQFISAILRTREGKQDRISPIEKIIKY